jgi:hypothetical protein
MPGLRPTPSARQSLPAAGDELIQVIGVYADLPSESHDWDNALPGEFRRAGVSYSQDSGGLFKCEKL